MASTNSLLLISSVFRPGEEPTTPLCSIMTTRPFLARRLSLMLVKTSIARNFSFPADRRQPCSGRMVYTCSPMPATRRSRIGDQGFHNGKYPDVKERGEEGIERV